MAGRRECGLRNDAASARRSPSFPLPSPTRGRLSLPSRPGRFWTVSGGSILAGAAANSPNGSGTFSTTCSRVGSARGQWRMRRRARGLWRTSVGEANRSTTMFRTLFSRPQRLQWPCATLLSSPASRGNFGTPASKRWIPGVAARLELRVERQAFALRAIYLIQESRADLSVHEWARSESALPGGLLRPSFRDPEWLGPSSGIPPVGHLFACAVMSRRSAHVPSHRGHRARSHAKLKADRLLALVQIAFGSGKTFVTVMQVYRLLKRAGARRTRCFLLMPTTLVSRRS